MDGGAWWAAVHEVAKSRTRLSDFTFTFHFHALDKEMATHSSVLSWRIPGTEEPGGRLSMGSHRVGHDWSDLAVAAATLQKRAVPRSPGNGGALAFECLQLRGLVRKIQTGDRFTGFNSFRIKLFNVCSVNVGTVAPWNSFEWAWMHSSF